MCQKNKSKLSLKQLRNRQEFGSQQRIHVSQEANILQSRRMEQTQIQNRRLIQLESQISVFGTKLESIQSSVMEQTQTQNRRLTYLESQNSVFRTILDTILSSVQEIKIKLNKQDTKISKLESFIEGIFENQKEMRKQIDYIYEVVGKDLRQYNVYPQRIKHLFQSSSSSDKEIDIRTRLSDMKLPEIKSYQNMTVGQARQLFRKGLHVIPFQTNQTIHSVIFLDDLINALIKKQVRSTDSATKVQTQEFVILSDKVDIKELCACLQKNDTVLIQQRSGDEKLLLKLWVATKADMIKIL